MDSYILIALGAIGFGICGLGLILWAVVAAVLRADDREDAAARDGFSNSMRDWGYVQDARNRGDL